MQRHIKLLSLLIIFYSHLSFAITLHELTFSQSGFKQALDKMDKGQLSLLNSTRQNYEITLDNKKRLIFNDKLLKTDESPLHWIIDNDGKMYGCFENYQKGLSQASLLGKNMPIAAGQLTTDENGYLAYLNNESSSFIEKNFNIQRLLKDQSSILYKMKQGNTFAHYEPSASMMDELPLENVSASTFKEMMTSKYVVHPQLEKTILPTEDIFLENIPKLTPSARALRQQRRALLSGNNNPEYTNLESHLLKPDAQGMLKNTKYDELIQTQGNFKWIMHGDGRIYISEKTANVLNEDHLRLTAQEWPVCAGELTIKNGSIASISNTSDFFKPSEQSFKQALLSLRRQGFSMDPNQIETIPYRKEPRLPDSLDVSNYRENIQEGEYFSLTSNIKSCND